MSVIDQLRHLRLAQGLTQAQVAMSMGTTQSAIARLEAQAASPRLDTLEAYAAAVGAGGVAVRRDRIGELAAALADAERLGDTDAGLRSIVQFIDDAVGLGEGLEAVLRSEPASTGRPEWDAAIAATVAWTARRAGVAVPGWTAAPSRFLDGPWFPVTEVLGRDVSAGLAGYLLAHAPADFMGRGVIIDEATLRSV